MSSVFESIGIPRPHQWQDQLASVSQVNNRLIRIPTGMGKTLGVMASWFSNRVLQVNHDWPTRLVWCLPMRTLVEQTYTEALKLIDQLALDPQVGLEKEDVGVHVLMGGVDEQRWYDSPEQPAILIGTQDMLISRALNRGYGMGRAAWPRAFGLLNNDALWVMDEVQLMGVGLATSSQVQAFWEAQQNLSFDKPRKTWWMSATLQPSWLESVETRPMLGDLQTEMLTVDPSDRHGPHWEATKSIERVAEDLMSWPELIVQCHQDHSPDPHTGRQTLVVLNTVKSAREIYTKVTKVLNKGDSKTTVRLIHSRFRPADREAWVGEFLSRDTLNSEVDRILIATQVVEAGVDISASCLITELAPWPSLVQRFGRAARYGGAAQIIILDQEHSDEKKALPYSIDELTAARTAVDQINGVSIGELEDFEAELDESKIADLYPYSPLHILMRDEFDELFDTSPDLSGADMDVSRFIREGDDRDIQVFWRDWADDRPSADLQPNRRELCSVPIKAAKDWVKKLRAQKQPVLSWDYLDGHWIDLNDDGLRPGLILLVKPAAGGYSQEAGFSGEKPKKNSEVPVVDIPSTTSRQVASDASESNEQQSVIEVWKTIATHSREAAIVVDELAKTLAVGDRFAKLLKLTLWLHDWGKAHPAFANGTYCVSPERGDLAKAPSAAWRPMSQLYKTPTHGKRRGFRHELASCLATLELLRGANPMHPAILGRHHDTLIACGITPETGDVDCQENTLTTELDQLSELEFNLLLYLIASHHGKVRVSLQASPKDQEFPFDGDFVGEGMPIRGIRTADEIPSTQLPLGDDTITVPAITLSLAASAMGLSSRYGDSWAERVQGLLKEFGPFTLSYLEAIVRTADGRASNEQTSPGRDLDPLLEGIDLQVATADGSEAESQEPELEATSV